MKTNQFYKNSQGKNLSTAENLLTLQHKILQGFLPLSLLTRDRPYRETCFRSHCNRCFSGAAICSKTAEIKAVCQPTPVANLSPYPLLNKTEIIKGWEAGLKTIFPQKPTDKSLVRKIQSYLRMVLSQHGGLEGISLFLSNRARVRSPIGLIC